MRKILLATDGSRDAMRAAHYIARLYKGASDVEVTVLNISPAIPPLFREPGHGPAVHKQFAAWKKRRSEEAKGYFKEATQVFLDAGFRKSHIKTRYVQQVVGVARDIVRELDAGDFDACIVGKKGVGWIDDIFLGTITRKLIEISENHPLWLLDGKGTNSRRVLIAMDETPRAVEIARYVGRMLHGLSSVHLFFYHYCTPFTECLSPEEREQMKESEQEAVEMERLRMTQISRKATEAVLEEGIDSKALKYEFQYDQSVRPKTVSQAILSKLKEEKCGTLVLGRKGFTAAREFPIGSMARRTIAEAEDCGVWLL